MMHIISTIKKQRKENRHTINPIEFSVLIYPDASATGTAGSSEDLVSSSIFLLLLLVPCFSSKKEGKQS